MSNSSRRKQMRDYYHANRVRILKYQKRYRARHLKERSLIRNLGVSMREAKELLKLTPTIEGARAIIDQGWSV